MCGLYATLELAAHGGRQLSAAGIATKYGISLNHLAKVLRALVRAKLVECGAGSCGRLPVLRQSQARHLARHHSAVQDFPGEETGTPGGGPGEKRALDGVLHEIDEITIATLRSVSITTLLSIIEKQQRSAPPAEQSSRPKAAAAGE